MVHRTSVSLDDELWDRARLSGISLPLLIRRGLDAEEARPSRTDRADDVIVAAEQLNNAVGTLMKLLNEGYEIAPKRREARAGPDVSDWDNPQDAAYDDPHDFGEGTTG